MKKEVKKEKAESRSAKLTRLSKEAEELDMEIQWTESRIMEILDQIREMNPTKREINSRDLQILLDCY